MPARFEVQRQGVENYRLVESVERPLEAAEIRVEIDFFAPSYMLERGGELPASKENP